MFELAWSALNPSVLSSSTGLCIHMSIGYIVLYTVQYITRYTYVQLGPNCYYVWRMYQYHKISYASSSSSCMEHTEFLKDKKCPGSIFILKMSIIGEILFLPELVFINNKMSRILLFRNSDWHRVTNLRKHKVLD